MGAWSLGGEEDRIMSKLDRIDQGREQYQNDERNEADRVSVLKELEEIAIAEEISWRQKSRCLWVE